MIDFLYTIALVIVFNIGYIVGGVEPVIVSAIGLIVAYASIISYDVSKIKKKIEKDGK